MFERVRKIIVEELGRDESEVKPDADLRNDLGISSLEFLNAVIAFEDEFGISFDENDLDGLVTVGDIVDYVENKAVCKNA